jgi:hypothetical protein
MDEKKKPLPLSMIPILQKLETIMRDRALVGLALLASLLLPGAVMAQRGWVNIDNVRVGFITAPSEPGEPVTARERMSYFKAGAWTPIFVDITAGPQGLENGVLTVEVADNDDIENTYTVNLPRLEPKESFQAVTYTKPGSSGGDFVITVREGSKTATHRRNFEKFDYLSLNEILYLSAGSRLSGLRRMANLVNQEAEKQGSPRSQYYHPRTAYVDDIEGLPARWFGYDAVDVMFLTTGNREFTTKLHDDQGHRREALAEWVQRGGHLVVAAGNNQDVVERLFQKMGIPLKLNGKQPVDRLQEVESWTGAQQAPLQGKPTKEGKRPTFDVAKISPARKDADIVLALKSDQSPLIVRTSYGLGRVTLVAFDLDLQPFVGWEGQSQFYEKLLTESHDLPRDPVHRQGNQLNMGFGGGDSSAGEVAGDLQVSLEQFEDVPMISFGWVALFILVYIIVVGPLDYLFLKKVVKRLELTWITFPAVVLLVSVVAYFAAYAIKGNDLRINKMDLVDIDLVEGEAGGARSYGQTWLTLFSPRIQLYTVGLEPASPDWAAAGEAGKPNASVLVSWLGRPDSGFGGTDRGRSQTLFRRSYDYDTDARSLKGVPIQVWSSKSFTARWEAPLDAKHLPFRADLSHPSDAEYPKGNPKSLAGSVTNQLPIALEEAWLIYGDGDAIPHVFSLGRLEPNQKKEIAITRNQGANDLRQWVPQSAQRAVQFNRFGQTTSATAGPLQDSLRKALFYDLSEGEQLRNNSIKYLDQKWRLIKHSDQAILYARLHPTGRHDSPPNKGPAEKINGEPWTPTRLWLGDIPYSGQPRPSLWGTMQQETYVRVFITVKSKN